MKVLNKRSILVLILAFVAVFCAFGLTACGHAHAYDKKVATAAYLKTAATCTESAVYYKSCECGEKGTETFTYGNALGHNFADYVSDNNATCTADGTKTGHCTRCNASDTIADANSALGHNYIDTVCSRCGIEDYEKTMVFELNNDTYTLVQYKGKLLNVVIPSEYKGLPVTKIGSEVFNNWSFILGITIPDSVTSIEDFTFQNCSFLENIYYTGDINNWVEIDGLNNLMKYGKSVKKLYIQGELLTEANITTATKINDGAFGYCSSLKSVTIGNGVTSIGDYAINSERDFRKTQQKIPNKIENSLQMIA